MPPEDPSSTHKLTPPPAVPATPVRVRAGRFGDLEAHELIHLLDSIDTEVQRARFRESLYISFFLCVALAWVILYGPRYIWHSPQLRNPADVLREREITRLTMPTLPKLAPAPHPTPRPTIDSKTMDKFREEAARRPVPAPPQPVPPPPAAPASPPPPPAPVPQPRLPLPEVPSAPAPTKPNFGQPSQTPGDAIKSALNSAAHDRGGSSAGGSYRGRGGPTSFGGVQILSDTQNVDFGPYIRKMKLDLTRNWIPLLPEETMPPISKQGVTVIRVSILPDGSIGDMHLDDSTHDVAIDKAAWGSFISEGQFPPLPKEFHGKSLEMRWYFMVNKDVE